MSIYEEKAAAVKQAVKALESCIVAAEEIGLKVDIHYWPQEENKGYQYIETVIVLPILNLP